MNLKLIPALGFLAIIIALGVILKPWSPNGPAKEAIHYHAGFQVYINDQLQDFSDLRFMNTAPCGSHDDTHPTPEEEQMEKAHLHDAIGDVVHVHREGAVWRDLFTNMEYELPEDALVMYIDGQLADDADLLDQPIVADQSVIFILGDVTNIEEKLQESVTLEHIKQTEQRSENCGV